MGVLSVRRSGDREFADSLLEGSGFEPRGGPFSGVRRGRFPPNLAGSVPVAMLEEQIYLRAIWFLIMLYLLLIGGASLSPYYLVLDRALSPAYLVLIAFLSATWHLIRASRTSPDEASHMPTGDWHSLATSASCRK